MISAIRLRSAIHAALALGLVVICTPLWGRFFIDNSYLAWLVAAAALGAASAFALVALHPRWPVAVATPLVLLAFLVWGIHRSPVRPSWSALSDTVSGLWRGVARLLTTVPPADVRPDLLLVPAVVWWGCGLAAAVLCLRTRAPLLPVVPGLVAFVAALLATAPSTATRGPAVVGWLALAVLLAYLRAQDARLRGRGGRQHRTRSIANVLSLGLVLALAAGSIALPVLAHEGRRYDPRHFFSPPVAVLPQISPLSLVDGQRSSGAGRVFTLAFDARVTGVTRLPVAVLDDYDGVQWMPSGSFRLSGSVLHPTTEIADAHRLTVSVTRDTTPPYGPYLPEVGVPLSITGVTAYADVDGPQLLATSSWTRFRMTAETDVSNFDWPSGRVATGYDVTLPEGVPKTVSALASKLYLGTRDHSYIGMLRTILQQVRSYGYSPDVPGQSYASLHEMLLDHVGNVEQHAVLFAVLARSFSIPVRIAVGYRLPDMTTSAARTVPVLARDAYAWDEIPFAGHGWVPFDPVVLSDRQKPPPPPALAPTVRTKSSSAPSKSSAPARAAGSPRTSPSLRWLPWLLLLLIPIAAAAGSWAIKALRRRRRRRRGTAEDRVLGAWLDLHDTLLEVGTVIGAAVTAAEAAEIVERDWGEAAADLARLLTDPLAVALYAPVRATEDEVAQAWRGADGLRRTCLGQLRLGRRLFALVSPAPLLGSMRRRPAVRSRPPVAPRRALSSPAASVP